MRSTSNVGYGPSIRLGRFSIDGEQVDSLLEARSALGEWATGWEERFNSALG